MSRFTPYSKKNEGWNSISCLFMYGGLSAREMILGSLLAVEAASSPDHIRLSWVDPVPTFDGNLSYRQYTTAATSVVSRLR